MPRRRLFSTLADETTSFLSDAADLALALGPDSVRVPVDAEPVTEGPG